MPVSYFTEVDEGYARASFEDGVGGVPSLVMDEPVGTSYLIFIDDLHAIRQHRDRVLSRLERDLVLLNPADRVAVVAFDGKDVSRLTDWTTSRQEIEQALVRARQRKARSHARLRDRGTRANQVRKAVMAATGTVRSLAGAPGRKVALLLADGWSTSDGVRSIRESGPPGSDMESLYSPLVHAANQVGFSLYPIDLPGFSDRATCSSSGGRRPSHHTNYSSTSDTRGWTLGTSYRSDRIPFPSLQQRCRRRGGHDVLRFLASQTGGQPMVDSQRDRALAETSADASSYYWLGFEAPRAEDDELHFIRVRLPGRRGLRVRTRKHYLDMSRGAEVTMLVEGALLFNDSPGDEVLDARLGTPRKAGFRRIFVPMEVEIPLDDLTLLPVGDQWMNELEFRVTLIDEHGARSETPVSKIPILGSETPPPGETFVYETDLLMRKRHHRYVAAVYDPLSGAILSASGELEPDTGTDAFTEDVR